MTGISPELMDKAVEAWEAILRDDSATAEEIVRGVLATHRSALGMHGFLGFVYMERNDSDDATAEFQKEEDLYPGNTGV